MTVVILVNPISGRGKAVAHARMVGDFLQQAGLAVHVLHTRVGEDANDLASRMGDAEALVVVGGDGTVRMAAPAAIERETPLYHAPQGTENLFAREFRMSPEPASILRALRRMDVRRMDVAEANGRLFLLMASVGYDAEVIHDLASRRRRSISHLSYLPPMLRQLRRWRPAPLSITVDGARVLEGGAGCVVVANSRQYAVRLDPAWQASVHDGKLDVVSLPIRSRRALIRWMIRCRLRRHQGDAEVLYRQGQRIEIEAQEPCRFQLDGDAPEPPRGPGLPGPGSIMTPLTISVRPGVLPVLVPGEQRDPQPPSE